MAPAQAHPLIALSASEEADLVARLRAGDERAFEALVDRHYGMMLAVARGYVRTRAVAEEVVQEAWVGVLNGIDRFEGRSSLKTWIMRIVANIAISRGEREARNIPFSAFAGEEDEPAVGPERFRDESDGFPGHWRAYPGNWASLPDDALLGRETLDVVLRAIEELQARIRNLRDSRFVPILVVTRSRKVRPFPRVTHPPCTSPS